MVTPLGEEFSYVAAPGVRNTHKRSSAERQKRSPSWSRGHDRGSWRATSQDSDRRCRVALGMHSPCAAGRTVSGVVRVELPIWVRDFATRKVLSKPGVARPGGRVDLATGARGGVLAGRGGREWIAWCWPGYVGIQALVGLRAECIAPVRHRNGAPSQLRACGAGRGRIHPARRVGGPVARRRHPPQLTSEVGPVTSACRW